MTEATYPDLAGKVIVVTGGSRGIGAQTAREFAAQGAKVCIVGRDQAALDEVADGIAKELAGTAGVLSVVADVTDAAAIAQVRDQVEAAFGPVDVLAAFAGGQGAPVPTVQLTEERWRQVLDSDLTSAFLTVQAFLPGMVERGTGAIVLMSSAAGRQPSQANLAYGVANAGLVMMVRQLATEVGPEGVRINCIAPSSVLTEKVERMMPAQIQEKVAAIHPLRRLGTTHDVAQTALFLASDAASWITGSTVDVAGGRITG
jgi:3-oxoacyl-[acyl-carrier protein] reductase